MNKRPANPAGFLLNAGFATKNTYIRKTTLLNTGPLLMQKCWSLLILIAFLLPTRLVAQSKLSITDLKVSGPVSDYLFTDLNLDNRLDAVVSYSQPEKNGQTNRFLAVFLQTNGGFLLEPNQVLSVEPEVIGFEFANLTGDPAPEIVLISASTIEVGSLKSGLVLKESIRVATAISFLLPLPDPKALYHINAKVAGTGSNPDQLLLVESGSMSLFTAVMRKTLALERTSIRIDQYASQDQQSTNHGIATTSYYPDVKLFSAGQDLVAGFIFQKQLILTRLSDFSKSGDKIPFLSVTIHANAWDKVRIDRYTDLNNDGLPDLIVSRRSPRDLITNRLSIELYWGKTDKGTIGYSSVADQRMTAEALVTGYEIADFNNDNRLDLVTMEMSVSMGNFLSNLVSSDAKAVYKFYLQKNNRFSNSAVLEKDVSQQIDLNKSYYRPVFVSAGADFDGDGFPELIVKRGDRQLAVFGGSSSSIVSATPVVESTIPVPLKPQSPQGIHIFDQKRQDLVLTYGSEDSEGLQSLVRIISR